MVVGLRFDSKEGTMPRIVIFSEKKLILNNNDIVHIKHLLDAALSESGLSMEEGNVKSNKEFLGEDPQTRFGWINMLKSVAETVTNSALGSQELKLTKFTYQLDIPAYELWKAYEAYLNYLFCSYVKPEDQEKRDETTNMNIIDNKYVYIKEILLRLFVSAISINKNDAGSDMAAEKIIGALDLFIKKINNSNTMYNKKIFHNDKISDINIGFVSEHKEWVYLLKQMQHVIELMHKNTQTIGSLIQVLERAKATVALQLIAYLSDKDISQERLLPQWIKYTLLDCEKHYLQQDNKSIINNAKALYKQIDECYNALSISKYQNHIAQKYKEEENKSDKVEKLYYMLTRTNILLAIFNQIDILFATTGWVLIVGNIITFTHLSALIEEYSKEIVDVLNFDVRLLPDKKGEIKKSFIANAALSGIDFAQELNLATKGLKGLESDIIKGCMLKIIKSAIDNLLSLQRKLNCNLINQEELSQLIEEVPLSVDAKIKELPNHRNKGTLISSSFFKKKKISIGYKEYSNDEITSFLSSFEKIMSNYNME
jgi:hypothetical protein